MSEKLKIAIIGAGKAGRELHYNGYQSNPHAEVSVLIERDTELGRRVATEKNIPHVFASLGEALKQEKIDIASICTPPFTHLDIARELIDNGISFLLEKPILTSLQEAIELDALLQAKPTKFSAIHNHKFWPGIQDALRMFERGDLGDIHKIDIVWMVNGANNYMTRDENFWCHKLPGGRWEEMIAHPIYKSMLFVGDLNLEHVALLNVKNKWSWMRGDEAEVLFRAKNALVNVKLSVNNDQSDYNHMIIYGTKKMIYVLPHEVRDFTLLSDPQPLGREKFMDIVSERIQTKFAKKEPVTRKPLYPPHTYIINTFIDYVLGKVEHPPVSWNEAFLTHKLVLETGERIRSLSEKMQQSA